MYVFFSLAFCVMILIVATSAGQLPPPPLQVLDQLATEENSSASLKSERTHKIIEYIYMDKVRKSRVTKKFGKDNPDSIISNDAERPDNEDRVKEVENQKKEEELEEESDTYVCRRMGKLQRVPLCVRLFNQPHYKDELKIKFSYLAYRGAKPECGKHGLAFHTKSMRVHDGVRQEMLLCPGRHHPLRTSWDLDDYRDVFYVSSGAVPASSSIQPASGDRLPALGRTKSEFERSGSRLGDPTIAVEEAETVRRGTKTDPGYTASASGRSNRVTKRPVPDALVVYKRERNADQEQFFVYDIIENFKPKSSAFAIVTEYNIEEDLHSMNAISYNNDTAEIEAIYIREMFKPLAPFQGQGTRLSRQDGIADLYESELVTLCWVILDQPQYEAINFEPQPPPKHMNEVSVTAQHKVIHFQHSVDYNKIPIKQTTYTCQPRSKRTDPERIRISSGARPNSYFVYTLRKAKVRGKYSIFEFSENLHIKRGIVAEKSVDVPTDNVAILDSPSERNIADFEREFINVVQQRNVKEDIVCKKLSRDQFRTLCVRLFQTDHYAQELKIFFNYRLSLRRLELCQEKKVTTVSVHLQSTAELYHRMGVCEGRHDILRTDHTLDDYKDLIHVSQGPDSNSVMVFRQIKTTDAEWYQVYDIVSLENLEKLEETEVTLNHIQEEYIRSLKPSYNSNGLEIEVIYIREVFKLAPVVDKLAGLSVGIMIALCYELFDRDPYKPFDFEISRAALYAWGTRIRTYGLVFAHSKEYNDEHPTQPMYPCYGGHKDSEVNWRKDDYLHRYKISSGSRPNSFFVYSLLSTENGERTYTVLEFVENVREVKTLKPVEIKFEEVHEDMIRGNPAARGARSKTGHSTQTKIEKPQRGATKDATDVKSSHTKNRPVERKLAELKNVSKNRKPVEMNQTKPPIVKSTPAISGKPPKVAMKNSKPGKIEPEPPEVVKQVIAETPIIQRNPAKPKVKIGNVKPITIESGEVAGVKKSVTNNERKTRSKSDDSGSVAIESRKPIARVEVPEVLKQMISSKLVTQPKPEEPVEANLKNSEPVDGDKAPDVLERVSRIGRKTWTIPDEPIKIAAESVESKQDIRPSPESVNSDAAITQLQSRPMKKDIGMSQSVTNEIEAVRQRLRSVTSNDRVPRPMVKPIETDIEKSEPVQTNKGVLKQNPGQGFVPPSNFRTGGKLNIQDTSNSPSYQTVF